MSINPALTGDYGRVLLLASERDFRRSAKKHLNSAGFRADSHLGKTGLRTNVASVDRWNEFPVRWFRER
jgi:hypothetical protein